MNSEAFPPLESTLNHSVNYEARVLRQQQTAIVDMCK